MPRIKNWDKERDDKIEVRWRNRETGEVVTIETEPAGKVSSSSYYVMSYPQGNHNSLKTGKKVDSSTRKNRVRKLATKYLKENING
jgi:hypothetical protein